MNEDNEPDWAAELAKDGEAIRRQVEPIVKAAEQFVRGARQAKAIGGPALPFAQRLALAVDAGMRNGRGNPRPARSLLPEGLVGLPYEEFTALFLQVKHDALHLEMRDSYGTEAEIPHLAKWAAGKPDDLDWLQPWCTLVRDATAAGKTFRRARVVSEPLSDYQRWAYSLTAPMVDAGEDIRWVPRARVSELMFPGNDFWLFDDELLVFLVFAGNGLVIDRPAKTDPHLIARCRASFEAAWALSIPHDEYTPALS